ncbi:MAG TPA: hypothetical protein VMK42_04900 [Anaeromyxobacteraceae bacterium]|nr:hypothetical protein [Anaeromyxobacteraceae bacterium]
MKPKTQSKRTARKLNQLRVEARRRMHTSLPLQHRWISSVLRGHGAYCGVQSNFRALSSFHHQVRCIWYRSLRRRSQKRLTRESFNELLERFPLPAPRLTAPRMALFA